MAAWKNPDARSGPAWRARRGRFDLRAWAQTAVQLAAGPKTFGMQLPRWPSQHAHRAYLRISLPLVFVAGYIGVSVFYFTAAGDFARVDEAFLMVAPLGAVHCTVAAILVTTAAAAAAGLWFRVKHGAQVTAPAMQAAGYASSLLPILCMGACLLFSLVVFLWEVLEEIAGAFGIFPGILILLMFVGVILVALLLYARLVGRITSGMLYANR